RLEPAPDRRLDLGADRLGGQPEVVQGGGGHAVALVDHAEQQMLGPDVVVREEARLLLRQDHDLARPITEFLEHRRLLTPGGHCERYVKAGCFRAPALIDIFPAMKRAAAIGALIAVLVVAAPQPALAADSSYRTLSSADNPDWMRGLADSRSLASLSIPGTHETMAIHGGAWTQAQEDFGDSGGTLAAQLTAGIRMIDIRARVNAGNTFTIHHGAAYQNANFDDVLAKLGDFLGA